MEDHLVSLLSQHLIAEMSRQKSVLEEDQVEVLAVVMEEGTEEEEKVVQLAAVLTPRRHVSTFHTRNALPNQNKTAQIFQHRSAKLSQNKNASAFLSHKRPKFVRLSKNKRAVLSRRKNVSKAVKTQQPAKDPRLPVSKFQPPNAAQRRRPSPLKSVYLKESNPAYKFPHKSATPPPNSSAPQYYYPPAPPDHIRPAPQCLHSSVSVCLGSSV